MCLKGCVKDSLLGYEKAKSMVMLKASMWAELEREEDSKQDAVETRRTSFST